MIALAIIFAAAAAAAIPELQDAANRALPDEGDAAAILDLSTGRLMFEHRPQWISERRIVVGSVMKLFTAYALLEEGLADRETRCTGAITDRFGVERPCWLHTGHGQVRFNRAIADSCNVWFYEQSASLSPAAYLRAIGHFGIGEPIDTDIKSAIRDIVPAAISERDLPDLAVGDAIAMELSPLSLLRAVSVIATRGKRITPVRARGMEIDQPPLERRHLERIAQAMEEVVESGTLSAALRGLDVAAKTGTAKKRGSKGTRALVVGYAPRKNPRFVFVVLKGQGRGAIDAGPAARALLEVLLDRRRKDPSTVEVLVQSRQHPQSSKIAGNCRARDREIDRLELSEGSVRACEGDNCFTAPRVELSCARAEVEGRRYGRALTVFAKDGELRIIAKIDLDEYVGGVVASEDAGAPFEAKKALAIVARTFAAYAIDHPRHDDAPLCDLTHCQAFRETSAGGAGGAKIGDESILTDEHGDLQPVFFHSTCGGKTIDARRVWPELESDHLPGVDDPFCKKSPHARWIEDVSDRKLAEALAPLAKRTLDPATLALERLEDDGTRWRISDQSGATEAGGEELHLTLARALGFGAVKSSDFVADRAGGGFRLSGHGLGHRVGLCQFGAAARAESGQDAAAILRAYFPKLVVKGGEPQRAPAIAVSGGTPEHAALFQSACTAIERELGRAKDAMRFELAETDSIERFVNETGRSRAEAAALVGRTIWLMPESVLAKFGDLTPIARHECVHAWLRANRIPPQPAVVEEAIALGFAGQAARLPPAKALSRKDLSAVEKTLRNPRDRRELEAALARAVATIWPIARTLDAIALREALSAGDWTKTRLGGALLQH